LENTNAFLTAATIAGEALGYRDRDIYPDLQSYLLAAQENAVRAKKLMSIPDPEYETPLDKALVRARKRYPTITFSYYGKNGTLTPQDWNSTTWHINEGTVVWLTINQ